MVRNGEEKAKPYEERFAKSDSPIYKAKLYIYSGHTKNRATFIFQSEQSIHFKCCMLTITHRLGIADETTFNPGFELVCEFQADFTAILAASPLMHKFGAEPYREIEVCLPSIVSYMLSLLIGFVYCVNSSS